MNTAFLQLFGNMEHITVISSHPAALQWAPALLSLGSRSLVHSGQHFPTLFSPASGNRCSTPHSHEVNFLKFHIGVRLYRVLSFCAWLVSLNIIASSSTHVATNGIISSCSWQSSIPLCTCTTVSWSMHQLMDTWVVSIPWYWEESCSEHGSAHVSWTYWFHFFWVVYPSRGILDHGVVLFLSFWESSVLFSVLLGVIPWLPDRDI